ncbi:hypothetical protein FKM82_022183 [Ascaphus truei]
MNYIELYKQIAYFVTHIQELECIKHLDIGQSNIHKGHRIHESEEHGGSKLTHRKPYLALFLCIFNPLYDQICKLLTVGMEWKKLLYLYLLSINSTIHTIPTVNHSPSTASRGREGQSGKKISVHLGHCYSRTRKHFMKRERITAFCNEAANW